MGTSFGGPWCDASPTRMALNPNLPTTLALHSLTRPWTHLPQLQLPPVGVSMTLRRSNPNILADAVIGSETATRHIESSSFAVGSTGRPPHNLTNSRCKSSITVCRHNTSALASASTGGGGGLLKGKGLFFSSPSANKPLLSPEPRDMLPTPPWPLLCLTQDAPVLGLVLSSELPGEQRTCRRLSSALGGNLRSA